MWCALSPRRLRSERPTRNGASEANASQNGRVTDVLYVPIEVRPGVPFGPNGARSKWNRGRGADLAERDGALAVRLVEGRGEDGGDFAAGGGGGDARGEELAQGRAEGRARGPGDRLVVLAARVDARLALRRAVGGVRDDHGDAELAVRRELVDHVVEEGEARGDDPRARRGSRRAPPRRGRRRARTAPPRDRSRRARPPRRARGTGVPGVDATARAEARPAGRRDGGIGIGIGIARGGGRARGIPRRREGRARGPGAGRGRARRRRHERRPSERGGRCASRGGAARETIRTDRPRREAGLLVSRARA